MLAFKSEHHQYKTRLTLRFLYALCSRSGLCHAGDCGSVEYLLHYCAVLGHLLPFQLLHLGPAMVHLQQHMEHRLDCRWKALLIKPKTYQRYAETLCVANSMCSCSNVQLLIHVEHDCLIFLFRLIVRYDINGTLTLLAVFCAVFPSRTIGFLVFIFY